MTILSILRDGYRNGACPWIKIEVEWAKSNRNLPSDDRQRFKRSNFTAEAGSHRGHNPPAGIIIWNYVNFCSLFHALFKGRRGYGQPDERAGAQNPTIPLERGLSAAGTRCLVA